MPPIPDDGAITPERLDELRTALAALAAKPIATLEERSVPDGFDRDQGLALSASSPLAEYLSELIGGRNGAAAAAAIGQKLYRLVMPARVATQMGGDMVKPLLSAGAATPSASASAPSSIGGPATFAPLAGMGAATVAAPLLMMAVAAGLSAYADYQRREVTALAEKLRDDQLARERAELNGCRPAIDMATGILLDRGQLGVELGLGGAVHTVNVAIAEATERVKKWQRSLDHYGDAVELKRLRRDFSGVDDRNGGEFLNHLHFAQFAIALKKRVLVLQEVAVAQQDPTNPFENFVTALKRDQAQLTELEDGVADVLRRLSAVRVDRSHGIRDVMMHMGDVDDLLRASYRIRDFDERIDGRDGDVAIEMVREEDGSVVVLPAHRALTS